VRDAGFLVGEFKTPLRHEVSPERLHFVPAKFLRGAGDHEVIRRADPVDLVLLLLAACTAATLRQLPFPSIPSPVRQRGGDEAAWRAPRRRGAEGVLFQGTRWQPLPEDDLVPWRVGQQPGLADPIEAGAKSAFEHPRGTVVVAQELRTWIQRIGTTTPTAQAVGVGGGSRFPNRIEAE
jgi:hypothetical protein